jgi:hypothetical protein
MKTNENLSVNFMELSPSESIEISGGFLLLSIIAGVAGACAIAYYTGYAVGKLTCGN